MVFQPILAHGSLGVFDEIFFVGIAVIFLGMMAVSWFISRRSSSADEQAAEGDDRNSDPAQGDRVKLR